MNSIHRRLILALFGGFLWLCAATPVAAETVLLFARQPGSFESSLFSSDLPFYGDRVTSTIQGPNSYKYGGAANTPNIVVDYGADEALWTSGYGDLSRVLYTGDATFSGDDIITVLLTADTGYNVILNGFDLAGWNGVDYPAKSVNVYGNSNQLLFSQLNVLAHGDPVGPLHTSMTFSGVQSQSLRIEIDLSNITASFGAGNVAIDNISFSQVTAVPEPTTYGAGLLALGAFYAVRRAKRARML